MLQFQVIVEMTNGGVDRSVECTGNASAMISAFECVHDVRIIIHKYQKFLAKFGRLSS